MNKRGIPFTPVQLGLCLLNGAGLIFCVGGDLFLLTFDRDTVSKTVIVTNLVLSMLTVVVCGSLIKRAGDMDLFDEKDSGDRLPAIVALRTYFCMIASDITGVLILMLAGALVWQNAGRAIPIYATLMFAAAGGIYYWRTSRMGQSEDENNAEFPEEQAENAADITAQAETPEPSDEQAAKVDLSEMQLVPIDELDDMSDKMDIFDELLDRIELLNEQEAKAENSDEPTDKVETSDEQEDKAETSDEQTDNVEPSDKPTDKTEISAEQGDNDNDNNAAAADGLSADTIRSK